MKVLQFGTGRFLRGFFAPLVPQPGSITVVQSLEGSRGAATINQHTGAYHLWTRGRQEGRVIDEVERVESLAGAVVATRDWKPLRQLAVDPELRMIASNTTAAGLELDARDTSSLSPESAPSSFPARLTRLLHDRFQAGLGGLTILPMELVERNADRLQALVRDQARLWPDTNRDEFFDWLANANRWWNNLVDRIVTLPEGPVPWPETDPLAVVGEPYRLLAIESTPVAEPVLGDLAAVTWTDDLAPWFLRKVRILNGLHTAMVARFLPQGFTTVRSVVTDPEARAWIEELLHEEILPVLNQRGIDARPFAAATLERFENPFLEHQLSDIAQGHATKLKVRIAPSADEFRELFGTEPVKLNEVLHTSSTGG